jgi:hypothetical protein
VQSARRMRMLKPEVALNAARHLPQIARRAETAEGLVCLTLALAILAVAWRIASIL